MVPLLLEEIVEGTWALIAQGRIKVDARAVAFEHIGELQTWFPSAVQKVVASFNGHPEFDRIYKAVEEVRICADVLCQLTYDRVRTPDDKQVVARCVQAAALVQSAVDDLRPLAGLRPLSAEGAESARTNGRSDRVLLILRPSEGARMLWTNPALVVYRPDNAPALMIYELDL